MSESDAPERVVENPTYGENDAPPQNTYEGVNSTAGQDQNMSPSRETLMLKSTTHH